MNYRFNYCFLLLFCCFTTMSAHRHIPKTVNGSDAANKFGDIKNIKSKIENNQKSSAGFTENKGQIKGTDGSAQPGVKFVYEAGDLQIFLMTNGIAYQFTRVHYPEGYTEALSEKRGQKDFKKVHALQQKVRIETFRMDMILNGGNEQAKIETQGKSSDYTNFYNHEALDVHQYTRITYREIYPGIDWVIYSKDGEIKYDFVVKPGGNPANIQMQFKHLEELTLSKDGGFTLKNSLGEVSENSPVSFQKEQQVATHFILKENIISFDLAHYNKNEELIIDPKLAWATYYGGTFQQTSNECTTDQAGNVYMTGWTSSPTSIAMGGHQNSFTGFGMYAYLVKFNSSGVRQWGTYYGGGSSDEGYSCATDSAGNVYLAGTTASTVNISASGHQSVIGGGFTDAFLVKFNTAGVRQWGTYYGGTGQEEGFACATDPQGNVYLSGFSSSTSNIAAGGHQNTSNGSSEAFLVKFNTTGLRLWGTYYGGPNTDMGMSCATDHLGHVYLAGTTTSSFNIASGGHQNIHGGGTFDGFLVQFDTLGVRNWATYYGGSSLDEANDCATDLSGNVFLTGNTESTNNISSGGLYQVALAGNTDAYLAKFTMIGTIQWATYYGGTNPEEGLSCTTDKWGNIFMVGLTRSNSGIASGGHQNTFGGYIDGFLVKFNGGGQHHWGTYYGATKLDIVNSCATDNAQNIYMSGVTECTVNIASGGHDNTYSGGWSDGFLVKFCNQPSQPTITGPNFLCVGTSETFSVGLDPEATSYTWAFPSGWTGTSTLNVLSVSPQSSGLITVSANNSCAKSTVQTLSVTIDPCAGFIDDVQNESSVSIYPNPNEGRIFILRNKTENAQVTIYNVNGSKLFSAIIKDELSAIDISSQPKGIYFIEVREGEKTFRKKIVVQ